jgi:2-oxo-4-hydroxy-4-carboxy-5-ureidoimidazoline decarboxylase
MSFSELNNLTPEQFVAALGFIFEDSPWVAERACAALPFANLDSLCDAMSSAVLAASRDEQLMLLRAHPDLGTRARIGESSTREQAGAGLDRLTPEEHRRLLRLNGEYKERFGFPFLYAVKGSGKVEIMGALERRLASQPADEFDEALRQVFRIARVRLEELFP